MLLIQRRAYATVSFWLGLSPHGALNPEFTYEQPPGFKPRVEQIFFSSFFPSHYIDEIEGRVDSCI